MNGTAYLDHNATAPVRPVVARAMMDALRVVGNASSVHRFGRLARRRIEEAREQVAALVGALPSQVVFTSGGTEANVMAIRGCGRPALVSAVEHDSVRLAAPGLQTIAVDGDGIVDLEALDARLAEAAGPSLVSVMLANNETGAVQPVAAVVEIARRHGALVHTDAVQAAGRLAVDRDALGVDFLTISAHKLGGPQGVGALVLGPGVDPAPVLTGGGQERGRRSGTENLPGIVGFGVAAEEAAAGIDDYAALAALRDGLERRLRAEAPEVRIFADRVARVANTCCFATPGLRSETQVMAFDLAGVAVSAGSACSSGKVRPSHVLAAMGVDAETAAAAIRVSFGADNTEDDANRLLEAWRALRARTGHRTGARDAETQGAGASITAA